MRALFIVALLVSLANSSTMPFLSILAIDSLGMSPTGYGLFFAGFSATCLVTSLLSGVVSDRVGSRALLLAGSLLIGCFSYLLVALLGSASILILAYFFGISLAGTSVAQVFAAAKSFGRVERVESNMVWLRVAVSGAWIAGPALAGFVYAGWGANDLFLSASAYYTLALFAVAAGLPRRSPGTKSHVVITDDTPLFTALRKDVRSIVMISMVSAMLNLVSAALPLIITGNLGGSVVDVARLSSLLAAVEIPFLLFWGQIQKQVSLTLILSLSGVIYFIFLVIVLSSSNVVSIYFALPVQAISASALLSIPYVYFHRRHPDLPGRGMSFFSVANIVGAAGAGLVFAVTVERWGASSAILAAMVLAALTAVLFFLEGQQSCSAMKDHGHLS